MSEKRKSKRVFIAIKIYPDESFRKDLSEIKLHLKEEKIRWVKIHHMHLTLRFLGDVESDLITEIPEKLHKHTRNINSFPLIIKSLGVFRSVSYPRVLWAGIKDNPKLAELKKQLDAVLERMGFEPGSDSFSPHLTLGRMRRINNRESLKELLNDFREKILLKQEVKSLVFFESILKPDGPEYIPLSEHFFN